MRARLVIAGLAACLALAPSHAKAPVDPRSAIAKRLTVDLRDDFTKHSQATIRAAIKPVEINSDGVQDWQVDWNAFGAAWCGTGGCRYQLWLGRRKAAPLLVFDRQMRELDIQQRGARTVFVFDFHGSECGGTGNIACPGEFSWSTKRGRMVLLPTPGKHTSMSNPIDYGQ